MPKHTFSVDTWQQELSQFNKNLNLINHLNLVSSNLNAREVHIKLRQEVQTLRSLFQQYVNTSSQRLKNLDYAYERAYQELLTYLQNNVYISSAKHRPIIACYISTQDEANTHQLIKHLLQSGYRVCVPITIVTKSKFLLLNPTLQQNLTALYDFLPMVWCEIKSWNFSDEQLFTYNKFKIIEPAISTSIQTFFQSLTSDTIEQNSQLSQAGKTLTIEQDLVKQFEQIVPIEQINLYLTPAILLSHTNQRLGMGGGYYDRNFARHTRLVQANSKSFKVLGYVFDWQLVDNIPSMFSWDYPVDSYLTINTKQIN